ncbi:Alpha/Beta hydrolase protein [Aspergillus venezuelensis]
MSNPYHDLPSPTHSFTIPSIYDGTQLYCRIYLPQLQDPTNSSPWRVRGAIVAHPYASLGGNYDDPVVSFVGGELLDKGFVVATFNFRGAGDSQGRTSWTAKPELADYVSVYGVMMLYLRLLRLELGSGSRGEEPIQLVLGGYSYGSLVASYLPGSEVVAELFRDGIRGTPVHEIFCTARNIFDLSKEEIKSQTQTAETKQQSIPSDANELLRSCGMTTSYLLISPLLPPINLFLTLFLDMSLEVDTQGSGHRRKIPCPKPSEQLCAHQTIAIYGDEDTFTSVSKLRKWSDELSGVSGGLFQATEIEGAGHFWREDGVEEEARRALRLWLRQ